MRHSTRLDAFYHLIPFISQSRLKKLPSKNKCCNFSIFDDHISAYVRRIEFFLTSWLFMSMSLLLYFDGLSNGVWMETSPSQKAHFYKFISKESHFYFVRSHCSSHCSDPCQIWEAGNICNCKRCTAGDGCSNVAIKLPALISSLIQRECWMRAWIEHF